MHNSKHVSRRRFVRQGLGAALAGVALPTAIPAHVLGAAGVPSAGNRLGIGYIGAGRRSGGLRNLPRAARIVGFCDVDINKANRVAAKYQCKAYQDYRKMLESNDLDAVIVSTPDHWHALPSIHACQADKDVYVEKPMTLTIQEGRAMVKAARKYRRIVQTGSQQRSMSKNRTGCELVRNGVIGKVHTVIGANYPSPWHCKLPGQPVPKGLDWDMWCGQVEPVPFHKDIYTARAQPGWISFEPFSGGEMTGWGAHGIDQVQWALGMDDSGPVAIWTEGPKFNPPTYTKPEGRKRGEDLCRVPTVCFKYASGVVFKLQNGPPGGAIFIGDKGKITINRGYCKVEPAELAAKPLGADAVRLYKSDHHMLNWIECIKTRKLPVADVEIGHRSATVCHLGNIARWVGRKLAWDPVKEVFPGDAEANKYLARSARKPYQLPETI